MQKSKVFITVVLMLISAAAFTQATTISPYSKYGIGDLRTETFSQNFAMGGTALGIRTDKDITFLNPASYSGLTVTTFDVGFTNNAVWLDDGAEKQHQSNPHISHIAFGIPMIKNKWGMSFGIMPFANTGYDYDEVKMDSAVGGEYSFYSEGEGALNKLYFGNALAFNLDSTSLISIGGNFYYVFGAVTHDQKIIYGNLPNGFNIWSLKEYSVADFGTNFGLQYQKRFMSEDEEEMKLTIGATYDIAANLEGRRTELLRTFTGSIDFGTVKDTALFIDDEPTVTQLPSKIGFGFSLEKSRKWMVTADYKTATWGNIQSSDSLYSYQNTQSIHVGGQFIPKYDGRKYVQRMAYRFGFRYSTSYLAIQNVDWTEYGIAFGVGLPIRRNEFTYPRLNLGIEYGSRGVIDQGLIKENFINLNIGVTINAIWFRKRKYD